jgi:hypothetical protein
MGYKESSLQFKEALGRAVEAVGGMVDGLPVVRFPCAAWDDKRLHAALASNLDGWTIEDQDPNEADRPGEATLIARDPTTKAYFVARLTMWNDAGQAVYGLRRLTGYQER